MALVFCDNCGHRVSTTAPRCPSCGVRGPAAQVERQPSGQSPIPAANLCGACGAMSYSTVAGYCTKCGAPFAPQVAIRKRRGLKGALVLVCVGLVASVAIVLLTRWWEKPANLAIAVSSPSFGPIATLLTAGPHAGEVLLAGGIERTETAFYSPATNTLSPGPSMNGSHLEGSATPLRNGQVLFAGDVSFLPSFQQSELYDPVTDKFVPTGNMIDGRYMHTAMLLPNGKVLMAGGVGQQSCEGRFHSRPKHDRCARSRDGNHAPYRQAADHRYHDARRQIPCGDRTL